MYQWHWWLLSVKIMNATDILCKLAPHAPGINGALCGNPEDLYEVVCGAAATGDIAAFDSLPPILMHASEMPSAQQLWGVSHTCPVEHASYKTGPPPPVSQNQTLLGAVVMTLHKQPHPALLFKDGDRIVARVYDVPMAALEAELYAQRQSTSVLEVKWKGSGLAISHAAVIASTGVVMQSSGIAHTPGYLCTNSKESYHLVRPGPIPFLYMQTPKTDHEVELVEKLLHAEFIEMSQPNEGGPNRSKRIPDARTAESVKDQVNALRGDRYQLETIFDRRPHPGMTRVAKDGNANHAVLATKFTRVPALITAMVAVINHKKSSHYGEAMLGKVQEVVEEIATKELGSVSAAMRQRSTNTLAFLTSCSPRLCTVRRLGNAGIGQAYVIASAIFAASDVGLAVRELSCSVDESSSSVLGMMWNMARRVDEISAILCIELGAGRDIRSLKLINSCIDYELDVDSAARFLNCPWVVSVVHLTSAQDPDGFFTIESTGVERDMLKVCDSVRKTYGLEAQRSVRPPPPPPAAPSADYSEFDKRLKSLEDVSKIFQHLAKLPAAASMPSTSTAAAPPGIPYTSPELERLKLAQKRWDGLGKRPR